MRYFLAALALAFAAFQFGPVAYAAPDPAYSYPAFGGDASSAGNDSQ